MDTSNIIYKVLSILCIAGNLLGATSVLAQTEPQIKPFSYRSGQSELDDLKARHANTRWPESETVDDWSQGVPLSKLKELVKYWQTEYDWRQCEKRLNNFDHFLTEIDGLQIHFIHVRSKHETAVPIILTHGWPGSIIEFLDVIEPLTNPTMYGGKAEDAFHVVIPSLPGFGFSGKPTETGWNSGRIANAWAKLMDRLGYERYVAQGGDWGAHVTLRMAQNTPKGLTAIHLNMPFVVPHPIPTKGLNEEEKIAIARSEQFETDGSGYFHLQSTRPQTIGYALTDSPVGLAAWIYEKFHAWTDNNGSPEDALTKDQMLDIITLYWLTETPSSSARLYYENANEDFYLKIPNLLVGCSIFPYEIVPAPKSWAEKVYPNLIYWNEVQRGGHFAAFEEPELFVKELRNCFRFLRE